MAQQDTPLELLTKIIEAYPADGGGSCVKAAIFHSRMLNDFLPQYAAIAAELGARVDITPDNETTLQDVVVTDDPADTEGTAN